MSEHILSEEQLISAVCFYVSEDLHYPLSAITAELIYDDEENEPFFAEYSYQGRDVEITMVELITATRLWIDRQLGGDAISAAISFEFDEQNGIYAVIR